MNLEVFRVNLKFLKNVLTGEFTIEIDEPNNYEQDSNTITKKMMNINFGTMLILKVTPNLF